MASNRFEVRPSDLRNAGKALNSDNERFKQAVSALEAAEAQLNGMWDGDANDAFHREFERDKKDWVNFYNLVRQYVEKLDEIAKTYEQAEDANRNIARQRTSR